MKNNYKSKYSIKDRKVDTSPSVIGLYEMLAQAQPVLNHDINNFLDPVSLEPNTSEISDE